METTKWTTDKKLISLLEEGAAQIGVSLKKEAREKLLFYLGCLIQGNQKANLTATSNPPELILKHFVDALTCAPLLPCLEGLALLDIGSGAGFPGLVLKIYRPDIHLTLLEASKKKVLFLKETISRLGLEKAEVLLGRAENCGRRTGYREQYDLVTVRAVAHLRVLAEYALPFLKRGGLCLCQKGPRGKEEIPEAQKAIKVLGGEIAEIKEVTLPEQQGRRLLLVLRKIRSTPAEYPRRVGLPKKRPL